MKGRSIPIRLWMLGCGLVLSLGLDRSILGQTGGVVSDAGVQITPQKGNCEWRSAAGFSPCIIMTDVPRPYFYPVLGPDESPMTRKWPLEASKDEEHDHPHHRGLWYAHGSVNGLDFWSETTNSCKIVHDEFVKVQSGKDYGSFNPRTNGSTMKAASFAPMSAPCAFTISRPGTNV
jgi:hypothetical protein